MVNPENRGVAAIPSETIDIIELALAVWRQRRPLYVGVGATVFLALVCPHNETYKYTAQMVVVPIQMSSNNAASRLSGLAGLTGIAVPQDQRRPSKR